MMRRVTGHATDAIRQFCSNLRAGGTGRGVCGCGGVDRRKGSRSQSTGSPFVCCGLSALRRSHVLFCLSQGVPRVPGVPVDGFQAEHTLIGRHACCCKLAGNHRLLPRHPDLMCPYVLQVQLFSFHELFVRCRGEENNDVWLSIFLLLCSPFRVKLGSTSCWCFVTFTSHGCMSIGNSHRSWGTHSLKSPCTVQGVPAARKAEPSE